MTPWTKIAAVFSVLASLVTIYNVAVRPKDAPPMWNSVVAAVGMAPKTTATARNCARVRKPVWPENSWAVRIAPGNEHREIARITPGDKVEVIEEAGPWVRLDKAACTK
jgi:hypothetical protein